MSCCHIGPLRSALSRLSDTGAGGGGENVGELVKVPAAAWTFGAFAPVVSGGASIAPPVAAWEWAAYAPVISISALVEAPAAAWDWTAYAPSIITGASVQVPAAAWTWTTYAPEVQTEEDLPFELTTIVPHAKVVASSAGFDPHTFEDMDFGDEATGDNVRHIIVALSLVNASAAARTLSSMTIGGVSGDIRVQTNTAGALSAIVTASPTGTSGDIIVDPSGNAHGMAIQVYRMVNGNPVPTDTASGTGTSIDLSLDIATGGKAVAAAASRAGGTDETPGWTGITQDYEDTISDVAPLDDFGSAASGGSAGTPHSMSHQTEGGGSGQSRCAVAASFEPAA